MENIFQAISTGIIQGTTEFLPVSSSGHLFLCRNIFGLSFGTQYVVLLHLGTLIAVLCYFLKDIWQIIKGLFTGDSTSWKLFFALMVGTIPAGLLGYFSQELLEKHLTLNLVISIALVLTGFLLYLSDGLKNQKYALADIGIKIAFFIGLFQALAIVPGLSRSGLTLFGALILGVKREDAFKFSFLLSIPVILGGYLLEMDKMKDISGGSLGFLFAIISGFVSLWFLKILIKSKKLKYFAFYCWTIATLIIGMFFIN